MRTNNVNSASFKGNFLLVGKTDVLDEIRWYMHRKHVDKLNNFDFMDMRNYIKSPLAKLGQGESCDLFLTENEHSVMSGKFSDIITEGLVSNTSGGINLNGLLELVAKKHWELDDRVAQGKPIENLYPAIFRNYLYSFLKIETPKHIMNAEEAFDGIQKGSFDIRNGVIR